LWQWTRRLLRVIQQQAAPFCNRKTQALSGLVAWAFAPSSPILNSDSTAQLVEHKCEISLIPADEELGKRREKKLHKSNTKVAAERQPWPR
jgi:hypothetical protein